MVTCAANSKSLSTIFFRFFPNAAKAWIGGFGYIEARALETHAVLLLLPTRNKTWIQLRQLKREDWNFTDARFPYFGPHALTKVGAFLHRKLGLG
jgi:hypothetical protein